MKSFNVIIEDINRREFKPYNVIPYLVKCYTDARKKPNTFEEFKEFVRKESMYQWWSRTEYEIILKSWPTGKVEQKIDIYWQIMMNIDLVVNIVMDECKNK